MHLHLNPLILTLHDLYQVNLNQTANSSCNSITFPPQPPTIQLVLRQILTEHKTVLPTVRQPISRIIEAETLGVHTRWHICTRVREEDWRSNVRIDVDGLQFTCREVIGLEGQAVATNTGEDTWPM